MPLNKWVRGIMRENERNHRELADQITHPIAEYDQARLDRLIAQSRWEGGDTVRWVESG